MFKLDKKNNRLLFSESDWNALLVNLFMSYARKFGGVVGYIESKKFFSDQLEQRAWFKKLNDNQKENVILEVLQEYAKGFKNGD